MVIQNYTELSKLMSIYNYKFYEDPYKLNIVGLRKKLHTNIFDDILLIAFKDHRDVSYLEQYPITTDPGKSSLMNPKNRKGTAILKPGQYIDTHAIDYHRGNYLALCQRLGPVLVYRDTNYDNKHDLDENKTESGFFGINIHKAGIVSKLVDGWSAGCQVFQNNADFDVFMKLCKTHSKNHGNVFTYTLINDML